MQKTSEVIAINKENKRLAELEAAKTRAPVAWGSNPSLVDCNAVNRITKALG